VAYPKSMIVEHSILVIRKALPLLVKKSSSNDISTVGIRNCL